MKPRVAEAGNVNASLGKLYGIWTCGIEIALGLIETIASPDYKPIIIINATKLLDPDETNNVIMV